MRDVLARGGFDHPSWWKAEWLPFAMTAGGDFFCVDSKDGKVFFHSHDDGPYTPSYESYGAFLAFIANSLAAGDAVIRDRHIVSSQEGEYVLDIGDALLD
jgi:cell wall assembly regulator SMI1